MVQGVNSGGPRRPSARWIAWGHSRRTESSFVSTSRIYVICEPVTSSIPGQYILMVSRAALGFRRIWVAGTSLLCTVGVLFAAHDERAALILLQKTAIRTPRT